MIKKKFLILALMLSLVLGFTCLDAFAQKKDILAVASPQDSKNLFWKTWLAGFQEACDQLGIRSAVVDGQGKEEVQLRGIEDGIVKGAKMVLYSPVGGTLGRAITEKCEEAKVYNATWCGIDPEEMPPSNFKYYTGFITDSGDYEGYLLAKGFLEALGRKGNIVAIHGVPG